MRRALGKGLSQLLQDPSLAGSASPEPSSKKVRDVPDKSAKKKAVGSPAKQEAPAGTPLMLAHARIVTNPKQPRRQFDQDALEELAASIREHGIVQPLVVRPLTDGQYELVAGERRYRASQLAGLKEVPVVVRSASAQIALEIALIENVQREDISAIECAFAYQRLIEEFGLSQEQVAQKVGKSRAAVANTVRLLKLPAGMQDAVLHSALSEGHARALLMVESPARQEALFERILAEGLSVRETERLARIEPGSRLPGEEKSKKAKTTDPDTEHLSHRLAEYFGTPTRLERSGKGGRLVVDYYSDDDLQRILDVLKISL